MTLFGVSQKQLNAAVSQIIAQIKQTEANIMSALDDATAAIKAAQVQLGTDLTTLITDLKTNNGAPTAAQLQALTDIATALTAEDTTVKSADPGPAPAAS